MDFKRRGRSKFRSGDFTIVRPSGRSLDRDRLELLHSGRDYDMRSDGDQIWLLEGEREVGYAVGAGALWNLVLGERPLTVEQVKPGLAHSTVRDDAAIVTEVRGSGFPLKLVETNGDGGLADDELAFVVAVALLGWRESDRAMIAAGSALREK